MHLLPDILPLEEELGRPIANDLLLAAALFVLVQALAAIWAVSAVRARDRFLRRRAALDGDVNAIPLAGIAPHSGAIPAVAVEPLVLSWRATKNTRAVDAGFLIIAGLVASLSALLILGLAGWSLPTSKDIGLVLLSMAAGGGNLAVLVVVFVHYLPTYFGRPYGVTAMADGIAGRPQCGRRTFLVRWEEMHLFEVDGSGSSSFGRRRYRIYGERAVAQWENDPAKYSEFASDGMTSEEIALWLAALVDVIRAHTGLAPRTWSRVLRAEELARLERERAMGGAAALGAIACGVGGPQRCRARAPTH